MNQLLFEDYNSPAGIMRYVIRSYFLCYRPPISGVQGYDISRGRLD